MSADNIRDQSTDKSVEGLLLEAAKANEPTLDDHLFSVFSTLEDNPESSLEDYEIMYDFRKALHEKYVIKEENVPYGYFEREQRIARERGYGNIPITEEYKRQEIEVIQKDQEQSLDIWINYLTCLDSSHLPPSIKYWILNEVVKLGRYDKATQTFSKRQKDTTAPFVELSAEALAYVSETLMKKYGEEYINLSDDIFNTKIEFGKVEELKAQGDKVKLLDGSDIQDKGKVILVKDDNEKIIPLMKKDIPYMRANVEEAGGVENIEDSFSKISRKLEELQSRRAQVLKDQETPATFSTEVGGEDFGQIYVYAVNQMKPASQKEKEIVTGQWIKYKQGSDYMILFSGLQGKGTGWCTAGGESTAEAHLKGGDFYVYYSNDLSGNPVNPRIAIRMERGNKIAEIRGIEEGQNMDPYILESGILDEKLEEFGDEGDRYKQREEDMKRLTEIDHLVKEGESLSKEDLRFLYELDRKIEGFGYTRDPRIEEIIDDRDIKGDLALLLDCSKNEISLTREEALKGGIVCHYGNLDLSGLTSNEGLILPQRVGGYLNLSSLTSGESLALPKHVGGYLDLSSLTSGEGLVLPRRVGGHLNLSSLTSGKGLILSEHVGGNLRLSGLTSGEGLVLPQRVGGSLDLSNLTNVKGLILSEHVGGYLNLSSLTSAEGLALPKYVGGHLNLSSLTSGEGLVLPKYVGGSLNLAGLTSGEGLVLPKYVAGYLDLFSLTNAKGLILSEHVGGNLRLPSLTSAESLILPEGVRSLYLPSLTSGEGLVLPESVDSLNLSGLTNAEGLILPKHVRGDLDLSSLTSGEGLVLPKRIRGNLDLSSLTSGEGLVLPKYVEGYLDLSSLTSVEGLVLPQRVGRSLNLSSLTNAEGLVLPEGVRSLNLSSLTSAEGLVLPESVDSLYLSSLTSGEGLVLPKRIGGNLDLFNLTSAEGLVLPKYVEGSLNLSGLTSAKGLILSEHVGKTLNLSGLTSSEGLILPESVDSLALSGLTSGEGLVLPQRVGGFLNLSSLTSGEGLVLPKYVGGSLYLSSLTNAEGLILPKHVRGNLDLSNLTTAKGLILPQHVGSLYLSSLTSGEGLTLPQRVEGDLDLSSLTSTEGLVLPNRVEGIVHLPRLSEDKFVELRAEYPNLAISSEFYYRII